MTSTEDLRARIERATQAATSLGLDALVITPGADLRYLVGYDAIPLERLTALILRGDDRPALVVPALEVDAAAASPAGELDLDVLSWQEAEDPYLLVASRLANVRTLAVDDRMWAEKLLRLQSLLPHTATTAAGAVLGPLRVRKSADEISSLRVAGAAIDLVHAQVADLVKSGRTEREIGDDIAHAIVAAGHAHVDFVIVGSGPNAASPHHEVSDRVLTDGDTVVVDIGGTMPDGYRSDCTRTYVVGAPTSRVREFYAVLQEAQQAAVAHVRPGVTCESVDAAARDVITAAGYGREFLHRTGHGIGLETHEDPYIVTGNTAALEAGMAFSVEPGIYLHGIAGARIEDIVVCGEDGPIVLNNRPRDLAVV